MFILLQEILLRASSRSNHYNTNQKISEKFGPQVISSLFMIFLEKRQLLFRQNFNLFNHPSPLYIYYYCIRNYIKLYRHPFTLYRKPIINVKTTIQNCMCRQPFITVQTTICNYRCMQPFSTIQKSIYNCMCRQPFTTVAQIFTTVLDKHSQLYRQPLQLYRQTFTTVQTTI